MRRFGSRNPTLTVSMAVIYDIVQDRGRGKMRRAFSVLVGQDHWRAGIVRCDVTSRRHAAPRHSSTAAHTGAKARTMIQHTTRPARRKPAYPQNFLLLRKNVRFDTRANIGFSDCTMVEQLPQMARRYYSS